MTTVIIIIVYGITVIKVNFDAEKQSQELVQGLVQVPFVSPDVVFDEKLSQFFTALDKVFAELKTKADLSTYGDVFVFRYVPVSTKESCAQHFSHSDERVGDIIRLVFIICIITHPPPGHHCLHAICSKKSTEISSVYHVLMHQSSLVRTGFAIMILNLIKVLQTTRAHPRVGVLIATVIKGIDDIVHFGILFLIVFITFAW